MKNRPSISVYGLLLTLWTVLIPSHARAQAPLPTLTGTVVDAASGQPVPFAVVEVRRVGLGVQATEQGTFVLDLPATLIATDMLRVSSLGFETTSLPVPAASPLRVALRQLAVALPEAVVRPSAPPVRLGPTAAAKSFSFGGSAQLTAEHSRGWQVARKFTDAPAGTLQAVRFYISHSGPCGNNSLKAPFRVRVYAADGLAGSPRTDLLLTSVITSATAAGWHEVNLSTYHIPVPAEGFFVAMEWLYTNAEFGCNYTYTSANKERKTGYRYGQSLGGYLGPDSPTGWYLSVGYPWQQFHPPAQFATKGVQSPAIQAIVQPD